MKRVAIIGAGGHAREVLDIYDALNASALRYDVVGWLVEPAFAAAAGLVRGRPILGDLDWLAARANEVSVICAVGEPALRRRLVERARGFRARFCSAVHPHAVLSASVTLGAGVVIAAGTVLTSDIRLGDHVHVNAGCTISHDAVLEDFATLSPGVHLAGGGVVEEGACVGTGAAVIPRVRVGAWSIVGAGCTVIRDVPPDSTVVGVPGRVVAQRASGWHLA